MARERTLKLSEAQFNALRAVSTGDYHVDPETGIARPQRGTGRSIQKATVDSIMGWLIRRELPGSPKLELTQTGQETFEVERFRRGQTL